MYYLIKDPDVLTPVEEHGSSILFKRDDLFQPFKCRLNGSKMRHMLATLKGDEKYIREKCHGVVATTSFIKARQGYLVARCAKEFGFRTIIGIGGTTPDKVIDRFPPFRFAHNLGAEIITLSKLAHRNVLESKMGELARKNRHYLVQFGARSEYDDANARQVDNIPKVDTLVIPCGSGVTAGAILKGISMGRCPKPASVYVVQIAGGKRKIRNYGVSYKHIMFTKYKYEKQIHRCVGVGKSVELDSVYESKVMEWLENQGDMGTVLFWVVGNFNHYRRIE